MPRLYTQKHRFAKQKDKYAYKISLFLSDKMRKVLAISFQPHEKFDQIFFFTF